MFNGALAASVAAVKQVINGEEFDANKCWVAFWVAAVLTLPRELARPDFSQDTAAGVIYDRATQIITTAVGVTAGKTYDALNEASQ